MRGIQLGSAAADYQLSYSRNFSIKSQKIKFQIPKEIESDWGFQSKGTINLLMNYSKF